MGYKVGDRVKYDSGEWVFYGIVTAIIENSLCPCYRLIVDRMEKKHCKFPITQFEFELAADNGYSAISNENHKWEISEKEYLKKQLEIQSESSHEVPVIESTSELVRIAEPFSGLKPKKKKGRKQKPEAKKTDETLQVPSQEEIAGQKKRNTWNSNLESYLRGEKSTAITGWVAQNRRLYKTGKLAEEKFNQLVEINFPFEAGKKGRKKKKQAT